MLLKCTWLLLLVLSLMAEACLKYAAEMYLAFAVGPVFDGRSLCQQRMSCGL